MFYFVNFAWSCASCKSRGKDLKRENEKSKKFQNLINPWIHVYRLLFVKVGRITPHFKILYKQGLTGRLQYENDLPTQIGVDRCQSKYGSNGNADCANIKGVTCFRFFYICQALTAMKRTKTIHYFSRALVVLFVFTLTLSIAYGSFGAAKQTSFGFTKKGKSSSKTDSQLPFEEKEIERDDEVQNDTIFICAFSEPILFTAINPDVSFSGFVLHFSGNISATPIYLTNHSILI